MVHDQFVELFDHPLGLPEGLRLWNVVSEVHDHQAVPTLSFLHHTTLKTLEGLCLSSYVATLYTAL